MQPVSMAYLRWLRRGPRAWGRPEGAGAGRGGQRRERLRPQRVDEQVVVNEPGGDDFLLARRAGDWACPGVVVAGFAGGVAVRVVSGTRST